MAKPITIEVTGDASKFSRAMDTVSSKLSDLESKVARTTDKMSSVGSSMSQFVTLPILGAAAAGVKFAGELEDARAMSGEVFGDMASDIQAFTKTSGRSLGIAEGDALEFANQFGIRLRNIGGLSSTEAAKISTNLLGVAADLGSAFGTSADVAAEAIGAALTGETEQLKKYGIIINETILKNTAMEMGLWDGVGAMDAATKQQVILAEITNQTALVQGDFSRNADGATNSQKIMAAELKNATTAFGTMLLPTVTKVVLKVTELIQKFQALSPRTQQIVMKIGLLVAAIGPALVVTAKLVNAATTVGKAAYHFTKFAIEAAKSAASVVRAVATKIAAMAQAAAAAAANVARQVAAWVLLGAQSLLHAAKVAAAWLISMGPIALVIAAVVALVAVIVKNWDHISAFLTAVWNGIKAKASAIWSAISGAVSSGIESVVGFITGIPGRITGAAESFLNAGKTLGSKVMDGLKSGLTSAVNFAGDVANGVWRAVKNIVNENVIDKLNNGIPDSLGTGPFKVSLPANPIPRLASGSRNFQGGYAFVGEQGPELVGLPRGSSVFSARETAEMGGARGPISITVNTQTNANPREIARELAWIMKTRGR